MSTVSIQISVQSHHPPDQLSSAQIMRLLGLVEWADDVLYELEHFHISKSAEKVALSPTVFSDL